MEKSMSENVTSRPWQSYNTVYTTAKAGMEGVDKEKVQRIVYEMSKGSKYFENEERKEAYTKKKIYSMQVQLGKLTDTDILQHKKFAENRIVELEATRDPSKIWLHVDMDAFYAAVETLANPSLEGKPMAVGSMSMISTANYEARKFGVRAAMPGFIAKKLCPQLIFVPKYDPNFMAASLDEAYLDITSFCYEKGMTGGEVAEELRASICKETELTCSAGVAPNRLLAKVCSDINKPNGQYVLPNERMAVMTFISSLPVRKIGGIGKVTESILKGCFGITTCEEMLQKSSLLCALFSRTSADFFLSVALGLGGTNTSQVSQRKGMSTERTFSPTEDESLLQQKLVDLSENLSADMKKEGLCGRTLTLKLKTSCFEIRTRAVTLSNYIFSGEDILRHATKLLKAELPVSLRLMGLRMSQFGEGRNGATLDPKQRTLSNFIVTEDVSASEPGDLDLSHSSFREDNFAVREGASSYIDTQGPSESTELPQLPGLPETGGHSDLTIGYYEDNVDDHDKVGTARTSFPAEATQFTESNTSSMLFSRGSSAVREPQSSSTLKEPLVWLNDYQCSICRIELPPTFAEERREHFDFHLAERLQNEEWEGTFSRIPTPKHRSLKHDQMSQSRQKKKQKASRAEGKHIPIHTFFAKTSQNF